MLFITKILLVIAAISVGVFGYALFRLISIHRRLEARVKTRLLEFNRKVGELQRRLGLIQNHALDYMNSISPEGARAMYQLQQMVASQTSLVNELQGWVDSEDTAALKEADRVLGEIFAKATSTPEVSATAKNGNDPLDNWEGKSEELLQLIGMDISLASEISRASGLPKKRQRKATSMSLEEAGIRLVFRNNNNPEK